MRQSHCNVVIWGISRQSVPPPPSGARLTDHPNCLYEYTYILIPAAGEVWVISLLSGSAGTTLHRQARIQAGGGGGRWARRPRWVRLEGRKKGHWCPLNGCSTPLKHNMAINILKSCNFVFAYVKNRSSPSHIRSSIPWRPPLAEILDPRLTGHHRPDGPMDRTVRQTDLAE